MQNGEIVQIGSGCPCTNSGKHQLEDWCRMCGGKTDVQELLNLIKAARHLLLAAEGPARDEWMKTANLVTREPAERQNTDD